MGFGSLVSLGLLVVAAANLNGHLKTVFTNRWFVEMGEASYGIYILHAPLWFWVNLGLGATGLRALKSSPVVFYAFLVGLIVVCLLVFRKVEKPLRARIKMSLMPRFVELARHCVRDEPSLVTCPMLADEQGSGVSGTS